MGDATAAMGEILETLMTAARSGATAAPGGCAPARSSRGRSTLLRIRPARVRVDIPADLVVGVDAPLSLGCSGRCSTTRSGAAHGDRDRTSTSPPTWSSW